MQNVTIQGDDLPNNMSYNYTYILAHVCIDDIDVDTIRKKNLQVLGGQIYVQCNKHILSIVSSTLRVNKCECGKINFSVVANFHVELSYARYAWKI